MRLLALLPIVAIPLLATPVQAAPSACAAYRYAGSNTTLCDRFGARDVDCPDVGFQVTVKVRGTDPWRLDADGDGKGCDDGTYPVRSAPSKSAKPSPSKSTKPKPVKTTEPTRPATSKPAAESGPQLAKTGPSAPALAAGAGGIVLVGVGLGIAARRRRTRFEV